MAAAAIFEFNSCAHFRLDSCILHRLCNIPTKFGEMCQILRDSWMFFAIQDCGSRYLDLWWICVSWWYSASHIRFATLPPNLTHIRLIVKKWQHNSEIQDGGGHHLEFQWRCIFYVTFAFFVRLSTFPPNLVRIAPIAKKWQHIFEIHDSGGRQLEFP